MKTFIRNGRIAEKFSELKSRGEKALITFITAGDPDLAATKKIISRLEGSGADIIELGIPFSDPMADGPTIQASSERAVHKGVRLKDVLGLVNEVRETSEIPIVLFGYYNPIFQYGLKRFARDAKKAGADGVLVVDLPAEEADELKTELDKESIDFIFLLTPTSTEERIRIVAGKASGFIYFVSVTGVTGARKKLSAKVAGYVKKVRKHISIPIGVGFGISTPEQVKEVCSYSDAVIVGSAIVNIIGSPGGRENLYKEVGSFVSGLKKGTLT
ncbi:MAG: tryptophan synthase subunit alpha [Deltaproteobacteria bacterium]|nr:tryptophan synthase subunit alpha [Deltaproteobacteria bacterium]